MKILKITKKVLTDKGFYFRCDDRKPNPSKVDKKLNDIWMRQKDGNERVFITVTDKDVINFLDIATNVIDR